MIYTKFPRFTDGNAMTYANNRRISVYPTFISLYTGCGGLDLGFIENGFAPIVASDLFDAALDTYEAELLLLSARDGYEHVAQMMRDGMHRMIRGDIHDHMDEFCVGMADVIIGGPPCVAFSTAGKMDPNDPRAINVYTFMTIVDTVQPYVFVMENVEALAKNKRWAGTLAAIVDMADKAGYDITVNTVDAADYGTPQHRQRMIMVGTSRRQGIEKSSEMISRLRPDDYTSVRTAINALPHYGEDGNDNKCNAKIVPMRNPILRKSPYAGMLFNGRGRVINLDAPSPTICAAIGGSNTHIIDQNALDDKSVENWVIGYKRQLESGGKSIAADEIPSRLRRLTVEECAALQSFPIDYPWHGSKSDRFKQIGNAVPPTLSRAVAEHVKQILD